MSDPSGGYLLRQLDISWRLLDFHLTGLTTDECLWRPRPVGPHVHRRGEAWEADWPEDEAYAAGPPSIAWITWHIGFWWSMALDHSFGDAALSREDVAWPGSAEATVEWLIGLRDDWRGRIESLSDADLAATERTRWPFRDRPFGDLVAWATIELMKNAAEIGFARFLYATRDISADGQPR